MTPEEQHSLLQSKLRQAMRLKEVEATQEQNDTVTEEPVPSLYPPGYWDCLRHLRASWGVQYVCGMPSYHMEQARRWRREMHHHGLARLPFLPTVLPALRPMEVEAQRVLREGSRRHAAGSSGWLPNSMQTSFTDALQSLPTEYKRYCLRGSLRYYSPKQLFYVQPHASLVRGDDPQGIVIQRKERDIPFGYQSSARLEKEQAAVLALFEEEASSISATEEQFVSECTLPTLENVATTSSAYDGLTLCIPTPGVQTTTLKQSWAALTLK
ncbi:hypothetical protein ADEAN_000525100 [Angomonas deanei]|uniref:Uncharacterized protein n=1 Tax=Angomonas deanei TaxID=59799 RepID=A0A7G2CFN2_9TRYP|nr:hypothetical protein ADEAN_000525100 [Angomonas deanei]